MDDCAMRMCHLHALNCYYFESLLMLIVILWLVKWLFAYQPKTNASIGRAEE